MLDFSVAALSASDKIKGLGAYAGIAAILGLAVLSVLYFAQARELKRLREWAGRAPERAAEMQERLQAEAQRRSPQPPAPAVRTPAAVPATVAAAGAVAQKAGAPAVPAAAAGAPSVAVPATGATPGVPATATAAATAAAGTIPGASAASATPAPGTTPDAAPGTTPDADATQAIPAIPAVAAPARPAVRPEPAVPPRAGGIATGAAASSTGAGPLPPLRRPGIDPPASAPAGGDGSSSTRTVLAVVGGGLAVVLVAFLLITQVFGGKDSGSGTPKAASTKTTSTAKTPATSSGTSKPAASQVVRGDYTVSVLNSTLRNGAAREAANKLESSGFKIGDVKQAVTQTAPVTLIAYKESSKRAALEVAGLLGVSPANVTLATTDALVAGSQANVVVTLGADKVQ